MEKESKKPLAGRYVTRIRQIVASSLGEVILREKLTSEKDKNFKSKLFLSILYPSIQISFVLIDGTIGINLAYASGISIFSYWAINFSSSRSYNSFLKRNLKSFYEYAMPFVEIDRVARGLLYLNLKGRNLVRLAK